MITQDIINSLKSYFENLTQTVTIVLNTGEHEKRSELVEFLSQVSSAGEKVVFKEELVDTLRSPLSFKLQTDGADNGIEFSGIPSGHEFNSLVLAILHSGGHPMQLDDHVKTVIGKVEEVLKFEVFVSLSCHNCPEVVQALNQFALLNDKIGVEMIDGGLYQELIEQRGIQGVPSVYLNGELFANGKLDIATLLEKLIEKFPQINNTEVTTQLPLQDVTVIGAGPAGVAAAIYAARKGLAVTIVADRFGGQVKDTMGIENLISVPKTTGPQLVASMQEHMSDYEITMKEHVRAERIVNEQYSKKIHLSSNEIINSKTVIIATGARWRELGIPGEKENIGNGVAYCPHCDGPFFKGKDVAVIGGGNSGIEAALDLAGIVKSVTVFEFMPELKADKVLVDKAQTTENIEIISNVATTSIDADGGKVSAINYLNRATDEEKTKTLDGVFVQIGLVPNSQFVQDTIETTSFGEILIDEKCNTSAEGIFACGDVTTVPYKQIVVSMGEGAKASLSAFEYLLTQYRAEEQEEDQDKLQAA